MEHFGEHHKYICQIRLLDKIARSQSYYRLYSYQSPFAVFHMSKMQKAQIL